MNYNKNNICINIVYENLRTPLTYFPKASDNSDYIQICKHAGSAIVVFLVNNGLFAMGLCGQLFTILCARDQARRKHFNVGGGRNLNHHNLYNY